MTIVPMKRCFESARALLSAMAEQADDADCVIVIRFRPNAEGSFDMYSESTADVRQSHMALAAADLLKWAAHSVIE